MFFTINRCVSFDTSKGFSHRFRGFFICNPFWESESCSAWLFGTQQQQANMEFFHVLKKKVNITRSGFSHSLYFFEKTISNIMHVCMVCDHNSNKLDEKNPIQFEYEFSFVFLFYLTILHILLDPSIMMSILSEIISLLYVLIKLENTFSQASPPTTPRLVYNKNIQKKKKRFLRQRCVWVLLIHIR